MVPDTKISKDSSRDVFHTGDFVSLFIKVEVDDFVDDSQSKETGIGLPYCLIGEGTPVMFHFRRVSGQFLGIELSMSFGI
ncbi:MAG: hypothetical protein ACLTZB_08320 [Streptococcus salivarius]